MELFLREPELQDEIEFMVMMREWEDEGGRIHPGLIRLKGRSFAQWFTDVQLQRVRETCPPERVPQELYFLADHTGHIYGAGSIRTELNEEMARIGGHLAYGIRPSARGQGKAKLQLRLLLQRCREAGLERVLITCLKENAASRAVIMACGGVYEGDIDDEDGLLRERYWVITN